MKKYDYKIYEKKSEVNQVDMDVNHSEYKIKKMWVVELLFQKRTRKPAPGRKNEGGRSTDDEEGDERGYAKQGKLTGKNKGSGVRRGNF